MKKLYFIFVILMLTFALFSCNKKEDGDPKPYEVPKANVIIDEVRTKKFYDKIELFYNIEMKSPYKRKEHDLFSVEYKNSTGTLVKPYARKNSDGSLTVTISNVTHNVPVEVEFRYHYKFRGNEKIRNMQKQTLIADGDQDVAENVEIASYEDYIKEAKANISEYYKNNNYIVRKNYSLTKDIDFHEKEFMPLGNEFSGTFDGRGYSFKNIKAEKLYTKTKVKNYLTNKDEERKFYFEGIFSKLLQGAKIQHLKIISSSFTNEKDENINEIGYKKVFQNGGFSVFCNTLEKNASISNVAISNTKVNLTVRPGSTDLKTSFENANFGLVVANVKGSVSYVDINASELMIKNHGSTGASIALGFGRIQQDASVDFISVISSNIRFESLINPNLLLNYTFGEMPSTQLGDFYKGLSTNTKEHLGTYVGIVAGYCNGVINSIFLSKNLVTSKEAEADSQYVVCRLNGSGAGFDILERLEKNNQSNFHAFVPVGSDKKVYKKGDKVRIYLSKRNVVTGQETGAQNGNFKRLYVNNEEILENDIKQFRLDQNIFYYDFKIYENTDILTISDGPDTREEALKNTNTFTIPNSAIYEVITSNMENDKYISYGKESNLTFKIKNEKRDFEKQGYAIITFAKRASGQNGSQNDKIYQYAKIDDKGRFSFIVRGQILEITFVPPFICETNFGQVAGKAGKFTSLFLSENKFEVVGDQLRKVVTSKNFDVNSYKYNVGLYTSDDKDLSISNSVCEKFIASSATVLNKIIEEEYKSKVYNKFITYKNIFITQLPEVFATTAPFTLNTTFDKTNKASIDEFITLPTLYNSKWFYEKLNIS